VAADDPDEIDDVLGDHPGRCDELVPGGVERDAETGPVRVEATPSDRGIDDRDT